MNKIKALLVSSLALLSVWLPAQGTDINEYLSKEYPGQVVSVKVTKNKVKIKGIRPSGKGYYLSEVTPWEALDSQGLQDNLIRLGLMKCRLLVPR